MMLARSESAQVNSSGQKMRHPLALRFNKALMPANAKASVIFFVGLALFYLSLSPGGLLGMGDTGENVNASNQIISNLSDWLHFRLATTSITWPRHGLFELIFEIPFLLISKLFWGDSPVWADRMLAFQQSFEINRNGISKISSNK